MRKNKELDENELLLVISNRIKSLENINYELLMAASNQLKTTVEIYQKIWTISKKPTSMRKIIQLAYESLDKLTKNLVHPNSFDCKSGRSDCCSQEISVSPMEIFYISHKIRDEWNNDDKLKLVTQLKERQKILDSLTNGTKHSYLSEHPCIFFDNENQSCKIYKYRPIACRSRLSLNANIFEKTSEENYLKIQLLNRVIHDVGLDLFALLADLQADRVDLTSGLLQVLVSPQLQNQWINKKNVFKQEQKSYPKNKEVLFKNKYRKQLFIIQPKGYKFEMFESFRERTKKIFDDTIRHLNIYSSSGERVIINLKIDLDNPEREFKACTERVPGKSFEYDIKFSTMVLYHVWAYSNTFAIPEYNIILWINECETNELIGSKSIKDAFTDYAMTLATYNILLHELSHIFLGHLDYLDGVFQLNVLDELNDEKQNYTSSKILIRKAFEADADRQAAQWLVGFFELTLGKTGLGKYFAFPSRLHAYEFYIYSTAMVFRLVQDLTTRSNLIHPDPNDRLNTFMFSLWKYFEIHRPSEYNNIYFHSMKSCQMAGEKFLVENTYDFLDIISNAQNLSFVDKVISDTGIRKYQHVFNLTSNYE